MSVRRRVMVTAVLIAGILWLSASPASAHTGFESSDPLDAATVDQPIEQITLRFSGPAQPSGEGFVILDPGGVVRAPDAVTPDAEQKVWTLRFDPPLAGGQVGMRWTVQAPDAHPINGTFSFIVDAAVPVPDVAAGADEVVTPPTIAAEAATPDLEEFLAQSEIAVPNAEGFGTFGRLLGFVGTMFGIGGLVFAAVVVRDHRRDMRSVLKAVRYSAIVVVVGTAIDLVAHLAIANNGWDQVLSADGAGTALFSAYGLAVGLRTAAGILLFAAAKTTHRQSEHHEFFAVERELVAAGVGDLTGPATGSMFEDPRWDAVGELPGSSPAEESPALGALPISPAIVASVLVLLASFTFDGHTVTEGNRWVTGAVDMIHVIAAAIWAGGVVAFAVVLWRRYRRGERLNGLEMAIRFSVIAGAALAVAGVAGTILAAIILDSVSELWTTPWGRLLIGKAFAVAAAASLGTYNHFVVIPWMSDHPNDDYRSLKLRNTATGEALLLIVVIAITAFLVGASSQP